MHNHQSGCKRANGIRFPRVWQFFQRPSASKAHLPHDGNQQLRAEEWIFFFPYCLVVCWVPMNEFNGVPMTPRGNSLSASFFTDFLIIFILVMKSHKLCKHWENYASNSFHIEWDMIVVTVFLSILNQMEFHLVQDRKENCHHDHIPFNVKGIGSIVFSVYGWPW